MDHSIELYLPRVTLVAFGNEHDTTFLPHRLGNACNRNRSSAPTVKPSQEFRSKYDSCATDWRSAELYSLIYFCKFHIKTEWELIATIHSYCPIARVLLFETFRDLDALFWPWPGRWDSTRLQMRRRGRLGEGGSPRSLMMTEKQQQQQQLSECYFAPPEPYPPSRSPQWSRWGSSPSCSSPTSCGPRPRMTPWRPRKLHIELEGTKFTLYMMWNNPYAPKI